MVDGNIKENSRKLLDVFTNTPAEVFIRDYMNNIEHFY
jgi:hypothetical protein